MYRSIRENNTINISKKIRLAPKQNENKISLGKNPIKGGSPPKVITNIIIRILFCMIRLVFCNSTHPINKKSITV